MTDREYAAIRKRVLKHFNWWVEWMGLSHWEWRVEWAREGLGTDKPGFQTNMQITAEADYMDFVLEVDVPNVQKALAVCNGDIEAEERALERMIVHELCHVFVSELRPAKDESRDWDEWIFHEERVVAQMTLAFIWVANNGGKRPRLAMVGKRQKVKTRTDAAA